MQKLEAPWIEDRLKRIASTLIESHRVGDGETIARYAARIPDVARLPAKRQFMRLIQVFHPDRLVVFVRDVAECRARDDGPGLLKIEALLEFAEAGLSRGRSSGARQSDGGRSGGPSRERAERYEYRNERETYEYGEDDFGYGDEEQRNDEYENYECDDCEGDEADDPFAEGSFMDAIKREFFGNCDLFPTRFEIEQFTGELDLSDYCLDDLSGAEACVNVTSLNLAMNRIDNAWPLRDLHNLEFLDLSSNELDSADDLASLSSLVELDLSFNAIDDVAFLLQMGALKCVSLVGNPVRDRSVLDRLAKNGVTVVI
jgi:hypothetical protein